MKPSHIDWCPMIPDHWEEKRIKDIAFLQSGNSITAMDFVEDANFLSMVVMDCVDIQIFTPMKVIMC